MLSSWKLLISATATASSSICLAATVYGLPILPTTYVCSLYAFMISPRSVVVVVFPFVPVIASTSPFPNAYASSTSPITATFLSRIAFTTGRSVGTPGLNTAISNVSISFSGNSPRIISAFTPSPSCSFIATLSNLSFPS